MSGYTRNAIKYTLRAKIDDWLCTIDDKQLVQSIKSDLIITGGAIPSMLLGETANDYDVYFSTKETALKVTQYYVSKFCEQNKDANVPVVKLNPTINIRGVEEERISILIRSDGVVEEINKYPIAENTDACLTYLENMRATKSSKSDTKYRPIFITQNAITLSDRMQLVIRFYGPPEEIHKNYDFVHTTGYYTLHDHCLKLNEKALESLLSKQLIYVGSLYPVCSLFRTRKFIKRGWKISAGELVKMAFQISELDLNKIEVLQDQLIGVDTTYMTGLISLIESEKKNLQGRSLDSSYVISLIDKIFNGDDDESEE